VSDRKVALDPRKVWADAWLLERVLARCMSATDGAHPGARSLESSAPVVLGLYRGPFLTDDEDAVWQIPLRNRLSGRFQRFVLHLGQHWESCANWDEACDLYSRAVELDPLAESFYRGQMVCLQAQGPSGGGHRGLQALPSVALYRSGRATCAGDRADLPAAVGVLTRHWRNAPNPRPVPAWAATTISDS